MSKLYIAEFTSTGGISYVSGNPMQLPKAPPAAGQVVTFTTTVQSAAFNAATTFVRLISDTDCHLEFGANPTATVSSVIKLTAGVPEYLGVTPGQKVAAINA